MTRPPHIPQIDAHLKLSHFRLLVALGDSGSLGRAATLLNVSQPALTKALRDLESKLGATLFERGPSGVRPNAYGAAMVDRARTIVAELDHAARDLHDIRAGREGAVMVGALLSAHAWLLPQAIAAFRAERPRSTIAVVDGPNDVLLPALRVGELDLVVGWLPESREVEGVAAEALYDEPALLVARPGHPLLTAVDADLSLLQQQAWVLPPPETGLRRRFDGLFRAAGLDPPRPAIQSVSPLLNRALFPAGDLLGVAPAGLAEAWRVEGVVDLLPLRFPELAGAVGVSLARHRPLSPAANALLATLRRVARAR